MSLNWTTVFADDCTVVQWLSYSLIVFVAVVSVALMIIPAPYGRYVSPSWGFLLDARLAWFFQELPSFLIPVVLWCFDAYTGQTTTVANIVLLCLFVVHYAQRSFIFPVLLKPGGGTPLAVFCAALMFCAFNGYLQSLYLLRCATYSSDWLTSPAFFVGVILFACGMAINIHSDHILRSLRSKPGETDYKIPRGGIFEYVSGANFFGEMVEWLGFAIACWSLPAAIFAFSTVCVVGPRAVFHHRWYQKKFDNYPANRKALIPFVF